MNSGQNLTKIENNYTIDSMDQLARLMSDENITVQHNPSAKTACFNTHNRILILPVWKETLPYSLYVLFISHEIGHALYTPDTLGKEFQDWLNKHSNNDKNVANALFSYFNIIEDARIEKMVKALYPGTRRYFYEGYQELLDRNFFDIKSKDVDTLDLIDKINIHCKVDYLVPINFSAIEQPFVDRAINVQTLEEVLQLSLDLFEYAKSNSKNDDQPDSYESIPVPMTQTRFEYMRQGLIDPNATNHEYYNIPHISMDKIQANKIIIDHTEVHKIIDDHLSYGYNKQEKLNKAQNTYNKFKLSSRTVVDYLISHFEMKKAATAYSKSKTSITGMINVNKLHSYKFNNDIFHRSTVVPKGKSHGMMVLVDWSGSMDTNMVGTIDQMLNLIFFCKKTNIPFVIYGFTNAYRKYDIIADPFNKMVDDGDLLPDSLQLMTLFSSDIRGKDYENCLLNLFHLRNSFENNNNIGYSSARGDLPASLKLGGTPLNTAIMVLPEIVNDFRRKTKVEVMNVIFISDGDSDTICNSKDSLVGRNPINYADNVVIFRDKKTSSTYQVNEFGGDFNSTTTSVLLKVLKQKTNANILGFYLTSESNSNIRYIISSKMNGIYVVDDVFEKVLDELAQEFEDKKHAIIENAGYDHYYIIPGGRGLMVDTENPIKGPTNDPEIEYLNSIKQMVTSRIVLNKFIEKISS